MIPGVSVNGATQNSVRTRARREQPFPEGKDVGAVVVGGDYQGLGIVRSLGQKGIPVCVIDDEHSISRYSRYCTRFVKVSDLGEEMGTVQGVLEVAEELDLQGWVLYPTRDEHVAAFSHHRAELSKVFRVPTAPWEAVQWAWDKRNTYKLAQELSIPTPITRYLSSSDSMDELDGLTPPFAIKPAIKEHFIYASKAKAWYARDHAELKRLFQKAAEIVGPGEVMVQELIPGGGSQQFSYCAFFAAGLAVGKMVVRRRRQHPLRFGRASTYVETLDIPLLEQFSERFLQAMNYYGLVEVEYKLDPRTSQFKLLDVNARTWGYHSIGPWAGVDFCYMLFADQVGWPVARCKGEPGKSWIRMTTDLPAAFMGLVAGEIDLKAYVRSLRNRPVEAVFSLADPLPGIAEILLVPYQAVKRGF